MLRSQDQTSRHQRDSQQILTSIRGRGGRRGCGGGGRGAAEAEAQEDLVYVGYGRHVGVVGKEAMSRVCQGRKEFRFCKVEESMNSGMKP